MDPTTAEIYAKALTGIVDTIGLTIVFVIFVRRFF